jgi:hypothetical protein
MKGVIMDEIWKESIIMWKIFITDEIWKGVYNIYNVEGNLYRMKYGRGFITNKMWKGIYTG